jgi:type IV secretory pathway TraG/TraD family ATPase VirD4
VRLTYAANDDKTARRISDLLGQATLTKMQKSFSGSGLFLSHRSENEQEFGRPLLTPAEVTQLSEDDGILLVGGQLPYRARKVRYFLDPRFRDRDKMPAPNNAGDQARELLEMSQHDWVGLRAEPPPTPANPGVDAHPSAPRPPTEPTGDVASLPLSSQDATAAWNGFFAKAARSPSAEDESDSPSTHTRDLPL